MSQVNVNKSIRREILTQSYIGNLINATNDTN